MKSSLKSLVTGAAALVTAGALVIGGAGVAFAATPPYEPDTTNQLGTILFYDAAGNPVTGGTITDAPFAKYAVASSNDPTGADNSAALYGYLPQNGVVPGNWSGEQLSGSPSFPVASPAWIAAAGAHRPVVTNVAADLKLSNLKADFPNNATDSYAGLYQLRIQTPSNTQWWAADIQITGTTWSLVYPTVNATTTTLSALPASPQTLATPGGTPATITLKATVTSGVPGAVQFFRGGSPLGSPVTVSGGIAQTTDVPAGPTAGGAPVTTAYTAHFTPALFQPSTSSDSSTLSYVVQNRPADATSTSLGVVQDGVAGDDVSFSSHVADVPTPASVPAGTVSWYDNGSATSLNAAPVTVDASGNAVFDMPTGFAAAGNHSVVAKFTPTDATLFAASQSAASSFQQVAAGDPCLDAASQCTTTAPFKVTVNAGTLVISTPYNAGNVFDLQTMQLDPTGKFLHTSATFGTGTSDASAANGVTIFDGRAGDLPWNATVTADDFVSGKGDKINAENLGFIGVAPRYISGNALDGVAKTVGTTDVPNGGAAVQYAVGDAGTHGLKGGPHSFATAAHGNGTVYVYGTMDLYAPSSTAPGIYTTTVTFTIG